MTDSGPQFPVFSIVTPSYNQGGYLAETIESVIGQKGDFLIDYIVVDGGSTDRSVAVIRHYEQLLLGGAWPVHCRGIRYRWLSEKDRGQADAIAKGFRLAEGEIFAWLNSDDTYLPDALEAAALAFQENPGAGLIYGDSYYSTPAGAWVSRDHSEEFSLDKLAYANIICQPSTFFGRQAYQEVGGLDRTLQYAMDFDLWIRIGKRFPCRYLPRHLATYRLHEESKTVRDETLYENSEEALRLTIRHFGWAPLTRVYNSCNFYCRAHLPRFLVASGAALTVATLACSVLRSLWLNRGIRAQDLGLLSRDNFRKLSKSRMELMKGTGPRAGSRQA